MTNREFLIELLQDAPEYATRYIECPYSRQCQNKNMYGSKEYDDYCDNVCKIKWLSEEAPE